MLPVSNMAFFSVDKARSLEIIKDVLGKLEKNGDISLNESMDSANYNDSPHEEYPQTVINHRHKLAVVELQLDLPWGPDRVKEPDVKNYFTEFYRAVDENDYNRSDAIEIHYGSSIEGDHICLDAYLHGTQAECDVSYPEFTYDEQYKCWIVKTTFWGAPNGLDGNDIVTILDFSDYFKT
jgi:hypothetical protein